MKKFYERETINQLIDAVSFETVLDYYSFPVTGKGKNRGSNCPKCGKDQEHFKINTHTNLCNCFVCGFKGNAIQFIRLVEGMGFIAAVEKMAGIGDFVLPSGKPPVGKKEISIQERLMYHAVGFYESIATNYPETRGITKEVAKEHRIGFAPGGSALYEFLLEKGFSSEDILASKLVVDRSGRLMDFFYQCVVFPIIHHGKVVDLYGRHIGKSQIKHVYLIGDFMLYNIDNVDGKKPVVYVESIINALSLKSAGYSNVVAVGGAKKFSGRHAQMLKDKGVKLAINGFDTGDLSGAGQEGAIAAGRIIEELGIVHAIMQLPDEKDINELILEEGYAGFKRVVQAAKRTEEFELRYKLSKVSTDWLQEYMGERLAK